MLLLFVVVEALAGLDVLLTVDGLLSGVIVDVGRKRNDLLHLQFIRGEGFKADGKVVDLIPFRPLLFLGFLDLAVGVALSVLAAVFLLPDLLERKVEVLKLVFLIVQLVVEGAGHLKFLLLLCLDGRGLLCAHEFAVDLVDDGAVALMARLEGRFLLVVRVALVMMLNDFFGDGV